jgi:hypothetical protein
MTQPGAIDQGNPPTAEATKAAQRAGIVSIGPCRDRYGFDSRYDAALRRMK